MADLPQIKPKNLIRAMERFGFEKIRQKGSHVFMKHSKDKWKCFTIPVHAKELKKGTLHSILKAAALTIDQIKEHC